MLGMEVFLKRDYMQVTGRSVLFQVANIV